MKVDQVHMKSAILCSSIRLILAACVLSLAAASAASRWKPENDGWIPPFNGKDFNGWYTYLDSSGKNKDLKGVFKVENGMIHVLDVPMSDGKSENGYLATNQEFSNVRLHVLRKAKGIAACSILRWVLTRSTRHP
jgi:hypothetical protein